jgi:hypothetical protein
MVSHRYASESEYADLRVSRRPCCMFDKCSGPEIEGMQQLKMVRCSGDVAMDLRRTKASE